MAKSQVAGRPAVLPFARNEKVMLLPGRQTQIGAWLSRFLLDQSGQSVTEYAVVMAVITLVALVSISAMGAQTLNVLRHAATNLQ
jgi:Flp pilus assembly pilin Flp